jgi:hypothetical protein
MMTFNGFVVNLCTYLGQVAEGKAFFVLVEA